MGHPSKIGEVMKITRAAVTLALFILCVGPSPKSAGQSGTQAIRNDVTKLYSASADERTQAANSLVAKGPSVIPSLLPVLCDSSKANFDRAWPIAAKALGELKAGDAAACLVDMLMHNAAVDAGLGALILKSDKTLADVDPAFAALLQIGEPTVHTIQRQLPFLGPEHAYLVLRVLRRIKTPTAKEAISQYINTLNNQIRLANKILDGWDN
jgi:hypothetical protein